jgi:hypothetical protein
MEAKHPGAEHRHGKESGKWFDLPYMGRRMKKNDHLAFEFKSGLETEAQM